MGPDQVGSLSSSSLLRPSFPPLWTAVQNSSGRQPWPPALRLAQQRMPPAGITVLGGGSTCVCERRASSPLGPPRMVPRTFQPSCSAHQSQRQSRCPPTASYVWVALKINSYFLPLQRYLSSERYDHSQCC